MGGAEGVKIYQFQLEQVRERLVDDPDNAALRELEGKLQRLIGLASSLDAGTPKPAAPVEPNPKKRAAQTIEFNAGDACEARVDGKWYEATVQNVGGDKKTCTVLFSGTAEARHCSFDEVRAHDPQTARKRPAPESSVPKTTTPSGHPSDKPQQPARKRGTKAEYVQKKEEEHRQKQESWQSFQTKFKGKR